MNYRRLNDYESKLIQAVQEKTGTDYEVKGEFLSIDSFICMVEDLMSQIGVLEEKVEDYKEYKEQYCNLCDKLEKDL